jgi:tetratricopeptide (TPR) repeat protein
MSRMSEIVLEASQPLSKSLLWKLQRRFYEEKRLRAWSQGVVPHYITSNPFLARSYARLTAAYLRDRSAGIDAREPVYLIELGAGSGRFGYQFLKQALSLPAPFKYVMTDFSEAAVAELSALPFFRPLVEAGALDFACFDAEAPQPLRLLHGGEVLAPGSLANPLLVVANYFFDGIPQDVFLLSEGALHEARVTLLSPAGEPATDPGEILHQLELEYSYEPAENEAFYGEEGLDDLLAEYRATLDSTNLAFPCAALRCLDWLSKLSAGGMLLLTADKGYIHEEALLNRVAPEVAWHGSLSMSVNYHALGRFFERRGGTVFQTRRRRSNLRICAMALGHPAEALRETARAFDDAVEHQGADDFFLMKLGLESAHASLSLHQILSYLRFSEWDAQIFLGLSGRLSELAAEADPETRQEIYLATRNIWNLYLPIGESRDLAFQLAIVLTAIDYLPEALELFAHSLQLHGPDASTFYNIAVCHSRLRQPRLALEAVEKALELAPDDSDARALRIRLRGDLAAG